MCVRRMSIPKRITIWYNILKSRILPAWKKLFEEIFDNINNFYEGYGKALKYKQKRGMDRKSISANHEQKIETDRKKSISVII